MLIALVAAPAVAAGPGSGGTAVMDFTDCQATIIVDWGHLPGNLKTYEVTFTNTITSASTPVVGATALDRTGGHVPYYVNLAPDSVNAYIYEAEVTIRDGKGNVKDTWLSGLVSAPCS